MSIDKQCLDYDVSLKNNKRGNFIRVMSRSAGRHSTDYFQYFERDNDGSLHKKDVTQEIAPELIKSINTKGPTEGFILDRSNNTHLIQPTDILHKKTKKETNFTSTGEKLNFHWPIFEKLKETGFGSIIRATLTLHQVCSSRCHFCSTLNRNKKDAISLEEAKAFVLALYEEQKIFNIQHFPTYNEKYKQITGSDIRLKGLILSGGGQPNLWPHFAEFVEWLSEFDIELGLITNGFPKNIPDKIYSNFKWVRLSITPEDASPFYPEAKFDNQYIPPNIIEDKEIAFGLSYVYGPWSNDDIMIRISKSINPWNLTYVRFLTDCNLGRREQLLAHKELAERLKKLSIIDDEGMSHGKIFHQLKYHGTKEQANDLWEEGQCFLQSYNVFWDTTGHETNGYSHLYPCDSVTVLTDDESGTPSARGFDGLKWGTVTNERVDELFKKPLKPFFDPRKICSSCLFMNNNQMVKNLINLENYNHIDTLAKPMHINFP